MNKVKQRRDIKKDNKENKFNEDNIKDKTSQMGYTQRRKCMFKRFIGEK